MSVQTKKRRLGLPDYMACCGSTFLSCVRTILAETLLHLQAHIYENCVHLAFFIKVILILHLVVPLCVTYHFFYRSISVSWWSCLFCARSSVWTILTVLLIWTIMDFFKHISFSFCLNIFLRMICLCTI